MEDLEAYFGVVTEKFRANPTDQVNSLIANAKVEWRISQPPPADGLLHHRRDRRARYHQQHHRRGDVGAGRAPALFEQMQADPSKVNAFVEESIRWEVPVKHFMRSATQDTEVAGQKIKAGDWMMLSYQSANRDESGVRRSVRLSHRPRTQPADRLWLWRACLPWPAPRPHGNADFVGRIVPHLKSVELAGTPQRTISNFVCGPEARPHPLHAELRWQSRSSAIAAPIAARNMTRPRAGPTMA
jgi:hypothetical protein